MPPLFGFATLLREDKGRVASTVFSLAFLLAGCGGGSDVPEADASGHWTEQAMPVGSSFRFTLTQQGRALTGTGTFQGEAGPSGTLNVSGSIGGDVVALVFQESTGGQLTFNGTLTPGVLKGAISDCPSTASGSTASGSCNSPRQVEFDRTAS